MFVVAGCQATPLLEVAEAPLDDVAVPVVSSVELRWPAPAGAAAFAMAGLIGRFGDHRGDPAVAQMGADRTRRVGLVAAQRIGPCPGASDRARQLQIGQQGQQHRGVPGLPCGDGDHQRQPVPVDELMDLRR